MCDFKPGDDAVCIYMGPWRRIGTGETCEGGPRYGEVCRVVGLEVAHGQVGLFLDGQGDESYASHLFRKVQRRDLSAWLETAATDTDHLDKPIKTPARPKVDALLKRVQSGAFG